ncbi:MAG: hypothetical protein QM737_07830 [Ferruginibacter sp.]
MTNNQETNKSKKNENKDEIIKPEPETLHTTDPQEHMEGPISSLMHKTGKSFDTDETKEEADDRKEKNI